MVKVLFPATDMATIFAGDLVSHPPSQTRMAGRPSTVSANGGDVGGHTAKLWPFRSGQQHAATQLAQQNGNAWLSRLLGVCKVLPGQRCASYGIYKTPSRSQITNGDCSFSTVRKWEPFPCGEAFFLEIVCHLQ